MRRIFIDTAHLLAILWPGDNLHALAIRVASHLARDTVVRRDLGITDVLTSDHDFQQEGFIILPGGVR